MAAPSRPPASTDTPLVDHTITRRIAAGDERAFAAFYEAWFAPALALARAVSRRDEAFCLDVVQDVMLVVARRLPALDGDPSLRAWMTRTDVNAVTDRVRAESRRRRRERAVADKAPAARAEPWLELAEQERHAWLSASVAALPAVEQALVQARFGGAASVTAVADDLGITPDAAHGRLRRALDKLRLKAAELWHG